MKKILLSVITSIIISLPLIPVHTVVGEESIMDRPAQEAPENIRYFLMDMEEVDEIDREIAKYFSSLKSGEGLDVDADKVEDIIDSDADHAADFYADEADDTSFQFSNIGESRSEEAGDIHRHTVAKGDTIWSIAREYKVKPDQILEHNPEFKTRPLYIGEEVLIYANEAFQGKVVVEQKTIYHRVRSGQTLSHIAARYHTTQRNLIAWNRIKDPSLIRIGQTIKIVKKSKKLPPGYKYANVFEWPIRGRITSTFGRRPNPFMRSRRNFHKGLDIANKMGTKIKAARDGLVILSGRMGGYGNVVFLKHAGGYVTIYGHNKVNHVKKGDVVKQGQVIAEVGRTGTATGPHLHFEVRNQTKPINPNIALQLREVIPVGGNKVAASMASP